MHPNPNTIDLICFSHLRWGFVFQRPQHLMSRFARHRRVFFVEEPVFEGEKPYLRSSACSSGVCIQTPVLPLGTEPREATGLQQELLRSMLAENGIQEYLAWYYTPMAKEFTSFLKPAVTVYDCMDELSAFAGAPRAMRENEAQLFRDADLVFTGGASLFASKRKQHPAVHLFPSSVDLDHFARARANNDDPADQARLPRPRLGYAGVIDERMDLNLIREIAAARPEWQLVMLGPVVKIDPAGLPYASNIHYLGMKQYSDLPAYLSGWDIGMLPFALNESTRFISPTKTPEYLAAGLRVISTPIRDVVSPYGDLGLVGIARCAKEFVEIADEFLKRPKAAEVTARTDEFLRRSSWDSTWSSMNRLMNDGYERRLATAAQDSILPHRMAAHV
ncbi:MAG TPA: glycosyltransferase family 1 protein [Bryobacteraceae bacterium]|nr:glycosyltransferase family 1 protein [Bryobacteraceae bacterium]